MNKKNAKKISTVVFMVVFCATISFLFLKDGKESSAATTAKFDAGNIISDYVMSNYTSMSEKEIQAFLKSKATCDKTIPSGYKNEGNGFYSVYYSGNGKTYYYHGKNGKFVCLADEKFGDGVEYGDNIKNGQTAAHIIWQAAQDYKINPQVLLVLLEKEQSLITDKWPHNYQYRAATGYGCPDTAACDSKYYGFKNQVRNAASLFRTVLNGGWTNYPLGNNYIKYNPDSSCGGSTVNIKNLATSALYRYTPYQPNPATLSAGYGTAPPCGAYGNRNFYLFFYDWFGDPTTVKSANPTSQKTEPLGAIIKSGSVADEKSDLGLIYKTNVQKHGWLNEVQAGKVSGTSGYALRVEGITIKLDGKTGIEYRTHIQDKGWENTYKKDGEISGLPGKSLQVEAIQIRLTGELAKQYDILYRVHVQDIGWMGWVKNDGVAGTTGKALRVEAIQIKVVKKTTNTVGISNINYKTHVQDIGWMGWVKNGATAGTTGKAKQMEAIEIKLDDAAAKLYNIEYRVHVQDIGWMGWVKNGATAGTTGKAKQMEAIEIRITKKN